MLTVTVVDTHTRVVPSEVHHTYFVAAHTISDYVEKKKKKVEEEEAVQVDRFMRVTCRLGLVRRSDSRPSGLIFLFYVLALVGPFEEEEEAV
jgi:hypothetical protein